jgi:iron complex transport system ATP-binding protein
VRLIEFQNVTVMRDTKVALDDVTLRISSGEDVAIIGPNGSGKSTLLKTITRELYPIVRDGSYARVLEQDRWNVSELRAHLGIVSPDMWRMASLNSTGREVVLSGFFSSLGIWPHLHVTPEMEEKAAEVLRLLNVGHVSDRYVTEVSSGEACRLMIGRALVHDPQALVLDEPSNSLDVRGLQELRETIRKLANAGKTIIIVTHHLSEIIPEITRVVLLKNGRVFRDGSKDEILRPEILSQLFEMEVNVARRDGYYLLA